MKKNMLNILALAALGVSIIATFLYDFYYTFFYDYGLLHGYYGAGGWFKTIIPWFFTILVTIVLLIGILTQKKIFFIVYYGHGIFKALISMVVYVIEALASGYNYSVIPLHILNGISAAAFDAAILLFIWIVFEWKSKLSQEEIDEFSFSKVNEMMGKINISFNKKNNAVNDMQGVNNMAAPVNMNASANYNYPPVNNTPIQNPNANALAEYQRLLTAGVITPEEYERKRSELMDNNF